VAALLQPPFTQIEGDIMKRNQKRSVTLMEMLIVIIIIGTLAAIGVPNYTRTREESLDREAQANLRLIIAAQNIHRMEFTTYVAAGTIAAINTGLRLALPAAVYWDYRTTVTGPGGSNTCAEATRVSDNRHWRMRHTEADPVDGSMCP